MADSEWHLNKSVPISVILAIVLQTAVILVWAVKLEGRVGVLENSYSLVKMRVIKIEETMAKLSVIEERQRVVIDTLQKNSDKMDRLLQRP